MKKQTMGMTIASKRKEAGMTQLDLAEKMGVTDKAVSKWERDLSSLDIRTVPKLAEVLGISVEELMQTKDKVARSEFGGEIQKIVNLVLSAIPLAMGIAVAVLSQLDQLDGKSGFSLLGIGLACAGIRILQRTGGAD